MKYDKVVMFCLTIALLAFTSCDQSNGNEGCEYQAGDMTGLIEEKTIKVSDMFTIILGAIQQTRSGVDENLFELLGLLKDINVAKIKYMTTAPDGSLIEESGLIAYPTDMTEYNHILSVQHETQDLDKGPTDQDFPISAAPVFGDEVVVIADCYGFGISRTADLKHTYMHLKSTGTACADMILAARQYLATKENLKCTADSIRLLGYSQGGQATIATLLELQDRHMEDQISLVWAGAGPYNLMNYMEVSDIDYDHIGFFLYSIEGIITGDRLDIDRRNIYSKRFFDEGKDSIFTKCYLSEWHSILGTLASDILNPDMFAEENDFNGNQDAREVIRHMRSNSIVEQDKDILINSKVRLYHMENDTYVPYSCSVDLNKKWPDKTELINLTQAIDHPGAGMEFFILYMGEKFYPLMKIVPLVEDIFN